MEFLTDNITEKGMAKPIDLKRIAKENGWRLTVEEGSQHSAKSSFVDPWLLIVPCQNGHLYPHGEKVIGVSTNSVLMTNRLKRLGYRVLQDGDDGSNFAITEDELGEVAKHLKPRRQRVLSESHKQALVASGIGFRYGSEAKESAQQQQ